MLTYNQKSFRPVLVGRAPSWEPVGNLRTLDLGTYKMYFCITAFH